MAISSSLGYRIKYEYETETFSDSTGEEWLFPTRILAINTTIDNCAPAVIQCTGLTENWPSLSFSNQAPAAYAGTITDNLGRSYTYTANTNGVTGVKFPGSSSNDITVTYSSGRVASFTQAGMTWTYGYSDSGSTRTTTITDPGSHATVTTSSLSTARVTSYENEVNETTAYQYDSKRRLTRVTHPEANYVAYAYDSRGNITEARQVAKASSALSDIVTTLSYPGTCANPVTCNKPTAITDPRGKTTNYTYNVSHGGVTKVELPAVGGIRPTTTYAYSPLPAYSGTVQRPTTVRVCATAATCTDSVNETKTTIAYGANSRLPTLVTTRAGDGSGTASATTTTYDHNNDVLTVNGPLSGTADTVYFRYDDLRRQVGIIGPDPDGAGAPARRASRITFNTRGLPTASERGTVNGVSDSHWSAFASLEKQTMSYDSHGRVVKSTLMSGSTTHGAVQYDYDSEGRPRCSALRMNPSVFGSLPGSACTASTAGPHGPDRISQKYYDAANRVTKVTSAYGTSFSADETSGYTSNGQFAWVKDGKGNQSTYEYDGFDRLAKLRYPHPANVGTSSTTDYQSYTYDATSNVTQHRLRDAQTVSYSYDDINRISLRNTPGSTNDQAFSYDLLGRILSVAISGHTNTFAYNALSQTTSATSPLGTVSYQYDTGGRRTRVTYPGSFYVQYDYDVTGAMTKVRENGASSGMGLLATYAYDNLGRRTSITRGNGVTTSYGFDAASRLNSLVQNLAGSINDQSLTLSYNPAGQIASRSAPNDAYAWTNHVNMNSVTSVNGLNQVTSEGGVTFSHDVRGNLTSDGITTYGYDADNRLTSASGGATFKYDASGRLYEATASGLAATRFLYDGVNLIAEYNTSGALQRRFVHGAGVDEPLAWYEGSGTSDRRWLIADERGSIIAATNSSGNPIAINSYDEYGQPDDANVGRFQYTGQAWIEAAELYYYKARFYAPEHGRFLQSDPIGYSAGLNLYSYVGNDPINRIDPSGNDDEIIVWGRRNEERYPCGRYGEMCGAAGAAGAAVAELALGIDANGELPGGPSEDGDQDTEGEQDDKCMQPSGNIMARQGIFVDFEARLTNVIGLEAGVDFASYVTELNSTTNYWSHSVTAAIDIGRLRLGFSWEERSYNGGLSFRPVPTNFALWNFAGSSGGLSYVVSPPQAFSGFTLSSENLENLIIECAH